MQTGYIPGGSKNFEQCDFEDQGRIGRNHAAGATRAVAVKAVDEKGGTVYEGTLHPGESVPFIVGDLKYE